MWRLAIESYSYASRLTEIERYRTSGTSGGARRVVNAVMMRSDASIRI